MITINYTKVSGALTNFPVHINITDNDLKTKALSNGYDIVFTNKTGTKLNHEIERYTSSTGRLLAWVNVTTLSSTANTVLYMYYNNPSSGNQQNPMGVWDVNYILVNHLKDISGTQYDSTSYHNDGTPVGGLNQAAIGKINGADLFDGTDDYLNCGKKSSLNVSSAVTFEAWVYATTWASPTNVPIFDKVMVPVTEMKRSYAIWGPRWSTSPLSWKQ